jgi:hypothetical protein
MYCDIAAAGEWPTKEKKNVFLQGRDNNIY